MTEHYYAATPVSGHRRNEFVITVRDVTLNLTTDAGVFSKDRMDNGTRLLIESLRLAPDWRRILDLGCGYGPIGLVLARLLPEAVVTMVDVNERAVELARENAARNGIENVRIVCGEGFDGQGETRFDLVVTNPPIRAGKEVIYQMVDESSPHLQSGGWFVAVIMTKHGAKSLEKKMAEVFGNVTEWEKGSGYRVVASRKDTRQEN